MIMMKMIPKHHWDEREMGLKSVLKLSKDYIKAEYDYRVCLIYSMAHGDLYYSLVLCQVSLLL